MMMLYNSESFAVMQIEVAATDAAPLARGGYDIVDKFSRKEIFLEGALADSFKVGVEALMQTSPSEEEIDDYIGQFTVMAQQPVVLH